MNANANAHAPHCYPYDRVAHHVARGAANLEQVVCEGQKFATKQEVCEFCWHLFFKAVDTPVALYSHDLTYRRPKPAAPAGSPLLPP